MITISTQQILKVFYVIAWIIFIGVCIETCGFLVNTYYTFYINPEGAYKLYNKVDFSALLNYDRGQFLVVAFHIIMVSVMQCVLFYIIVKFLHNKKLNWAFPFDKELGRFIFRLSYFSLFIGILSAWGEKYASWIASKGIAMPEMKELNLDGANVWMFMGIVLLVLGFIFKRGIEIQEENELTI